MSPGIELTEDKKNFDKKLEKLAYYKKGVQDFLFWMSNNNDFDFSLMQEGPFPKLNRLDECGSVLWFRDYYNLNKIKLHRANFCMMGLLCPLCAIRRVARHLKNYYEKYIELEKLYPGIKMYYLVVTIKDGINLEERFIHLNSSFRTFINKRRKNKHLKNRYSDSPFVDIVASVYSTEVHRGKNSKLWHPHTNFILLSGEKIDYKKVLKEWKSVTGDSINIHFEYISKSKRQKTFYEVLKYAIKFNDLSNSDRWIAYDTLRGRKLLGSFGQFRGLNIEKEEKISDIEPYIELIFRYLDGKYVKDGV